ncbi:MAG: glycosyltransferase family 25 protein [Chlamydiae bacterium]|nr:glycosyltransferase family 25 protein [Chlamydiota bacterium]
MNRLFQRSVAFCIFFCMTPIYPYLHKEETPTVKYLQPIDVTETHSGFPGIDCIYVINLDQHPQKWELLKTTFSEFNLSPNRVPAINGWEMTTLQKQELFGPYPIQLTGGQIGCMLSHISILNDAYKRGFKKIWILEDDVIFTENPECLIDPLTKLEELAPDWDIFYTDTNLTKLDGSYLLHPHELRLRPKQRINRRRIRAQNQPISSDILTSTLRFGLHSYLVSEQGVKKILDYFKHTYLWSPIDWDIHVIPGIKEYKYARDLTLQNRTISNTTVPPDPIE